MPTKWSITVITFITISACTTVWCQARAIIVTAIYSFTSQNFALGPNFRQFVFDEIRIINSNMTTSR
jgi:hypothetical protein